MSEPAASEEYRWADEWPARGLLRGYRDAWAEIYRLRSVAAVAESERAAADVRRMTDVELAYQAGYLAGRTSEIRP